MAGATLAIRRLLNLVDVLFSNKVKSLSTAGTRAYHVLICANALFAPLITEQSAPFDLDTCPRRRTSSILAGFSSACLFSARKHFIEVIPIRL